MNEGKIFEHQFKKSLEKQDFYVIRLVDAPSSFGKDSKMVRFSAKNPYDFIAYHFPYLYCLELKSTKGKSLSFQTAEEYEIGANKTASIKYHQVKGLLEACRSKANIGDKPFRAIFPLFIFNFREVNETYAISISAFVKYMEENLTKKSINISTCREIGTLISQKLLRTNYEYDVSILKNENNIKI